KQTHHGCHPSAPDQISFVLFFSPFPGHGEFMSINRRGFLGSAIAASLVTGLNAQESQRTKDGTKEDPSLPSASFGSGKRPIIICANNGFNYLDDAFAFL